MKSVNDGVEAAGRKMDPTRQVRGQQAGTVSLFIHWVPVEVRMPDDELTVLVLDGSGDWQTGYHADGEWHSADRLEGEVTKWAAVPTPIEGKELQRVMAQIVDQVCGECRVAVEEIRAEDKRRHVVWARFCAAYVLQRVLGVADREVSGFLNRTRSDVSHMRKQFRDWLEVDHSTQRRTAEILRAVEGRVYGA